MRRRIRLTENNLHRIIRESVKKILKEYGEGNRGQYMLGALAARKKQQGIEKGMTDNESGYNDISRYAANKRNGTNAEKMKQNSFYNGFHSGKDSREYGYNYMKNLDKQNENRIRGIVRESVKRVLNEVSGWTLEKDDVTWVNDSESGASDKAWMVRIWPGSGYYLPAFGAYATSEQDAVEKVVAYLDQEGDDSFFCDENVEEMKEELAQEGKDQEEIWKEIDNEFCYVDATMDGADEPHYLFWENLSVYPYDKKRFAR